MERFTRRKMLATMGRVGVGLALSAPPGSLVAAQAVRRIKIGACDWSLGKMATPDCFELAKEIGLDGVQVSLGSASDDMKLRQPEVQRQFQDAARASGVQIASLAIGEMNNVPYKSDPRTETWVGDSVEVMQALGVKVVLLAFFGKGDLVGDKDGTDEVVRRLKKVAPRAEKVGVLLGLESWLSAEETMRIMDRVGSSAVKMYYDVCNSTDRGYDVPKEIRWLGKKNICEFHMKENGFLLGQGKIDFRRVRDAVDDIGYTGWMQIEGAVPRGGDVREAYKANCKYLRSLFPL
jgi:sugar phosphate isomerase/epimerase